MTAGATVKGGTKGLAACLLVCKAAPALASGDPAVVYWLGGEALAVAGGMIWVLTSKASWPRKLFGLGLLLIGLACWLALGNVPDYSANHLWINVCTMAVLLLSFAAIHRVLRRR
jgi:peptidoglycan/LPS O-acetylase OafA/YrhL